jgi:hypothetical protein
MNTRFSEPLRAVSLPAREQRAVGAIGVHFTQNAELVFALCENSHPGMANGFAI